MKKAVSTSAAINFALATPNLKMTQSASSVLCLLVSQPSYQAPAGVNLVASLIGRVGLIRFSAAANHSSLNDKTFPPTFSLITSA